MPLTLKHGLRLRWLDKYSMPNWQPVPFSSPLPRPPARAAQDTGSTGADLPALYRFPGLPADQPANLQPFRPRKNSLVFREARQAGRRIHLAVNQAPSQWPFVIITLFRTSRAMKLSRGQEGDDSSSSFPRCQPNRTLFFSLIEIGDSLRLFGTIGQSHCVYR